MEWEKRCERDFEEKSVDEMGKKERTSRREV
jgi:hypothetical protein